MKFQEHRDIVLRVLYRGFFPEPKYQSIVPMDTQSKVICKDVDTIVTVIKNFDLRLFPIKA